MTPQQRRTTDLPPQKREDLFLGLLCLIILLLLANLFYQIGNSRRLRSVENQVEHLRVTTEQFAGKP